MTGTAIRKYAIDLAKRTRALTGEDYDLYHSLKRGATAIATSCGEINEGVWTAGVMNDAVSHACENRFLISMLPAAAIEEQKARRVHLHFIMVAFDAKKKRKFDAHKKRGKE